LNGRQFKDYYKILGLDKGASVDEIKKAYRKLARKYHPDVSGGDKASEEKFKEINEAYEVLSDPKRRQEYDQGYEFFKSGGFRSGFEDFGFTRDFFGFGETFSDLFDFFDFGARTRSRRGRDLQTAVRISFEDAVKGVTLKVPLSREVACPKCGGSGAKPGTAPRTCPECQGRGYVAVSQGLFSISRTCSRCLGQGIVIEKPCSQCRGRGRVRETKKVNVKVPAGVEDGSRIRLKEMGEPGVDGGPPGDLYLIVNVIPHPIFRREGADILLDLPITFAEAALGAKITIPTLDGQVSVKIPPGTQSGRVFRVRNKGAPRLGGFGRGDLLAKVKVVVPTKLSKKEKALIKEIANLSKENPRQGFER
jgi:molecular chaperone DnaJ